MNFKKLEEKDYIRLACEEIAQEDEWHRDFSDENIKTTAERLKREDKWL